MTIVPHPQVSTTSPTPEIHYSPSQVETSDLCLRKWAYGKIDGVPAPSTKAALLGNAGHDALEAQFKGLPVIMSPDVSRIMEPAQAFLPNPRQGVWIAEKEFITRLGPHKFIGRMDLERDPGTDARYSLTRDGVSRGVIDLKTTSDFKWAKAPEYLADGDNQSAIYADVYARKYDVVWVGLRWLYTRTKGAAKAKPVDFAINTQSDTHRRRIDIIVRKADRLNRLRVLHSKASEYPASYDACGAFGGCPYRAICPLDPIKSFASFVNQESQKLTMSNPFPFAFPFAQTAPAAAPTPAPAQAAAPTPAPAQATPPAYAAPPYSPTQAFPQAAPAPAAAPQPEAPVDVRQFLRADAQGRITHAANGLALPPQCVEHQTLDGVRYFREGPIGTDLANAMSSVAEQYAQTAPVNPPATPAPAPAAATTAPAPAPEAPKRGRPKGSRNKGTTTAPAGKTIGELFVDCLPDGEACARLGDFLTGDDRDAALAAIDAAKPDALAVTLHSADGGAFYDALIIRAERVVRGR